MAVHRIEIRTRSGSDDPRAAELARQIRTVFDMDPGAIASANVYHIEGPLDADALERLAQRLLADPVTQTFRTGTGEREARTEREKPAQIIEIHPLPGVMDPIAQSVETSIKALLDVEATVRSGIRYEIAGISAEDSRRIAERLLANRLIHDLHFETFLPNAFPHGQEFECQVREIPVRDLDDAALGRLSREAHLFLSLTEMQCIREHYREHGREPRDIELETLAQTWSEHCVHKTLKSTIRFRGRGIPDPASRPGHEAHDDGSVTIHNLLKSTVAAATHELMSDGIDWCLSVFVDNAGIVKFDDDTAVCFKVETHNHPSALEPYGGAATGIGGCIRDIIGTGLAAKPIASTDVFCVAHPDNDKVPSGCIHPRRILSQVVAGVRDYGNRMGIPTLNGAVWFDDRYIGNPLVYCGCVGEMPIDMVTGDAQHGDHIIVLGGRTGRDGVHGATFSSAELTDTHADEFSHAVQIGNAITEKKVLDAILQARDHVDGCLFNAITDCGAGGFSSAVGEMGERLGADVHLERAPLKYAGLTYTEIWISEAQERMVLAVSEQNIEKIAAICDVEDVEWCDLGTFGTPERDLVLNYRGTEVGRLSMEFLHDGVPMPTRDATWTPGRRSSRSRSGASTTSADIRELVLRLLAHPNIASKHWIVRQYDHEVQGRTIVRPFAGEHRIGPSDAAVILPKRGSTRGLAIANGLATNLADDPYQMALAAIDECVRNLVCVGANPTRIAILDNFCWPSCAKAENLGSLVLAAEGCYDGAKAYRTPFISGKDSLNNQFTTESGETIEIPPTLLISGFGIVPDVARCVTMDAKHAGNQLLVIGLTDPTLGGSHVLDELDSATLDSHVLDLPRVDLELGPRVAHAVAALIQHGLAQSVHDVSDGGLLVAAAEMAFAGGIGLELDIANVPLKDSNGSPHYLLAACFAECASRFLVEVRPGDLASVESSLRDLPHAVVGTFNDSHRLTIKDAAVESPLEDLLDAWRGSLDW